MTKRFIVQYENDLTDPSATIIKTTADVSEADVKNLLPKAVTENPLFVGAVIDFGGYHMTITPKEA